MKNNIINLARQDITAMTAYRSARSEALQGNVYLDANENPFCNPRFNRYPEQQPTELVALLANKYGIDKNQLLITRGSDEGIDLLVRLFCCAGIDKIIICPPTYGMYKVAATIQGAETIEVPLIKPKGFTLDVDAIMRAWEPGVKLVFVCSPNNPTGNVLPKSDILSLCRLLDDKSIVVVDEAYIEFSDSESVGDYINDYPNLIILRTLSKAYGLASVRCGSTIANNEIITMLKKIIAPYPIPAPVTDIIKDQLNSDNAQNTIDMIKQERSKLVEFLNALPIIKKVWKSQTNFLLIQAVNADIIMNACLKNGIVLRNRSNEYGLNNCIRITIGSPNENALLREVLSNV